MNILALLDFSPVTERVAQATIQLAAAHGADVVALHIVQPPVITADYALATETMAGILASSENVADQKLEHFRELFARAGLRVQVVRLSGAPLPTIEEQLKRLSPAYVVMGSHGHTALYDLLVGSTTHGVLRRAQCPVVIVPPLPKS